MSLQQLCNKICLSIVVVSLWMTSSRASAAPLCSSIFRNSEETFERGYTYFGDNIQPHILNLLRQAQTRIDIEMFIEPNESLFEVLKEKAQQGVKIRAVLDGRDLQLSKKHQENMTWVVQQLKGIGAEVHLSDSPSLQQFREYPIAVLHRKMINIDDRYFYVGSSNFRNIGRNVEVGYFGPLSEQVPLRRVFETDLSAVKQEWKNHPYQTRDPEVPDLKEKEITLVGPGTNHPSFKAVLLDGIHSAKKDIILTAFEASEKDILQALIEKKKTDPSINIKVLLCGAKINVWLAGKKMMVEKNSVYKARLREAGIEVREFYNSEQLNHSRLGLFDNLVYGASADLVERSFKYNVDLGFITRNSELSKWSKDYFEEVWQRSKKVTDVRLRDQYINSFFQMIDKVMTWIFQLKIQMLKGTP